MVLFFLCVRVVFLFGLSVGEEGEEDGLRGRGISLV